MTRLAAILILCILCGAALAAPHGPLTTREFAAHWQTAMLRQQTWPLQLERKGDCLNFRTEQGTGELKVDCHGGRRQRTVLYLVDRDSAFTPTASGNWGVLETRSLLRLEKLQINPNPEQQPLHEAVLLAVQALELLLKETGATRVGLVGEGYGATLALAVAALKPDEVDFVCAHEPVAPPTAVGKSGYGPFADWQDEVARAAEYLHPLHFAALVEAPTLLTYGEADKIATPDWVATLYEELSCRKELLSIRRGRHCQPADLGQWAKLWQEWVAG